MIDLSPALPPNILAPSSEPASVAVAGVRAVAAADFGQTLGAFLDARDAAALPPPVAGERQTFADDGKDLPETGVAVDNDLAASPPIWGIALALPQVSLPAAATPETTVTPRPSPLEPRGTEVAVVASSPDIAASQATPDPSSVRFERSRETFGSVVQGFSTSLETNGPGESTRAQLPLPVPTLPLANVTQAATPARGDIATADSSNAVRTAPERADPTATTARAIADVQVSTIPQPARQVFAAAIAAATRWQEPARTDRDTPVAAPTLALDPLHPATVLATEATHDAPLDLGKDRGLQQAIDRIETLRDEVSDGADARNTRIRLIPDALGGVEIAVRKQGEQVHVHFTAERAETQALLIDAQPRLTELAAARGVRIAESSVSTGTSSQSGGGATPQPRPTFATPRSAIADADDPTTDHRLA